MRIAFLNGCECLFYLGILLNKSSNVVCFHCEDGHPGSQQAWQPCLHLNERVSIGGNKIKVLVSVL